MADLPDHVITLIFLRVPTKPLFRFKSLSKHWNRLISDPQFIKSRSRRMIFLPGLPFDHAIDNTAAPSMAKLTSPIIYPKLYKEITIVGSFNGIFFLVLKYCKPLIIEYKWFHDHMILYKPTLGRVQGEYYEVFDLKTWSWSRPSELIRSNRSWGNCSATFANGFLYWNAERREDSCPAILAFDIKNMVFSEIEYPDGCYCLGTYNARLCMLCPQVNMDGFELRVMNEHRSWSTICLFTSSFKSLISHEAALGGLCILDDGKLLMSKSSKEFIIYDMFEDSYEEVNALTSVVRAGRLHCVEYVESLISPSDVCSTSI
ncbi:F-box/kelch-repeat protein At3g06240-like [Helianthus annuus]|uniref:F-box/kelch-repeat protein At3g06240-like n=1 Tax=Helianthus annuus TaxID=4232 RepID=UPI000B8F883F|nr:F-box/kelch-repeat protein At3g06240-like [Helianthus annuus]